MLQCISSYSSLRLEYCRVTVANVAATDPKAEEVVGTAERQTKGMEYLDTHISLSAFLQFLGQFCIPTDFIKTT